LAIILWVIFAETISIFGYRAPKIIVFSYVEVANGGFFLFSFSILYLGHVSNLFSNMHLLFRRLGIGLIDNSGIKETV
jgi:hypothetical protein